MHPWELSALLHQALESRVERILQLTAREGWLDDVGAVHDVRVASRRLRTALSFVASEAYPGLPRQRKRAKAITVALGATRELDVHVLGLASLGTELPDQAGHAVLEHVLEVFERRRSQARRRMVRGIDRAGIPELRGLIGTPRAQIDPGGDPALAVRDLLAPKLRETLGGAGERISVEDAPALHRLRISVKKLRYAVEVLAGALPPESVTWLARLKEVQGALGEHHDWTTLEAELWETHAELTNHRRAALAAGTLDLLGIVVERRRAAFEALQAAAQPLDLDRALEALLPGGSPA